MKAKLVWFVRDEGAIGSGEVLRQSVEKYTKGYTVVRVATGPARVGIERTFNPRLLYPSKRAALAAHAKSCLAALRRARLEAKQSGRYHAQRITVAMCALSAARRAIAAESRK